MTDVIVETNVAVVANGQNTDVVLDCQAACIRFLMAVVKGRITLVDADDAIQTEYLGVIAQARPYQVGAQFLVHLLRNSWNEERVRRISLPMGANGEFSDFPDDPRLTAFDRSDRKFAAVARRTGTPVTNATDSDWANHKTPLAENGINVEFLCGCDPEEWFISIVGS